MNIYRDMFVLFGDGFCFPVLPRVPLAVARYTLALLLVAVGDQDEVFSPQTQRESTPFGLPIYLRLCTFASLRWIGFFGLRNGF